jgi:hypothetical protein
LRQSGCLIYNRRVMTMPTPSRRRWFQFGIAAVLGAPILVCAGLGPLLDGADDPNRGAIGQVLLFASVVTFLCGVAGIAYGFKSGR